MDDEFHKNSLRFQCQPNCGACCSHEGEVFVTGPEIHRLATLLRLPTAKFRKRYLRKVHGKYALIDQASGACIFLSQDLKCTVYEARPDQCRTYPFWPQILRDQLSWEWESLKCPGIGKGEVVPLTQIRKYEEFSKKAGA